MTTPTAARDRTRATGADLREAFRSASAWLAANAERINALNVFPVPDGDTGTNMSMTLQTAVAALPESESVAEVARAAYEAAMLGARGNSGVILSQLLRGFADALSDATELTPGGLASSLVRASEVAYGAVSRPVEGTILTVAREVGVAAKAAAGAGADLPGLLGQVARAASDAVAVTPDQLEVLRKAGVVDSGGEGYRVILEGAWMWSTGRSDDVEEGAQAHPYSRALVQAIEEESTFGFCTEYLLREADIELAEVKTRMEEIGESVIAVGDQSLMRVHVHTLRPGRALEFAVEHGTLARVKVENMELQHQAMVAAAQQGGERQPVSSIGVIAVAAGEGFLRVFRSLGAHVVPGGQTMNPSVQEILAAVNRSGCKELIILPNNANIWLTAQRIQELTPHSVAIIPTKTVPQGIGALLAFNFQSDMQTNVSAMQQAAHAVHTIEVTRAVRDAEADGFQVQAGQFLGLSDGHVVDVSPTADDAMIGALSSAHVEEMEIVTIYHGAGTSLDQAEALAARVREEHSALAVEVVEGGQPHYPYVVSLE